LKFFGTGSSQNVDQLRVKLINLGPSAVHATTFTKSLHERLAIPVLGIGIRTGLYQKRYESRIADSGGCLQDGRIRTVPAVDRSTSFQ